MRRFRSKALRVDNTTKFSSWISFSLAVAIFNGPWVLVRRLVRSHFRLPHPACQRLSPRLMVTILRICSWDGLRYLKRVYRAGIESRRIVLPAPLLSHIWLFDFLP